MEKKRVDETNANDTNADDTNADETLRWFFALWVAKEAVLKSVGYGLAVPPQSIIVDPQKEAGRALGVAVSGPDGRCWESEVALFPGFSPYAVSVATARIGGPRLPKLAAL